MPADTFTSKAALRVDETEYGIHRPKGASAHRVFQRVPELKMDIRHVSFWQRGYGYRRLEPAELPRVRQYVRNHREMPEPRVFNPREMSSK